MSHGAFYAPDRKLLYLFGGHPAPGKHGDGRFSRADFYGPTKLGTWSLHPGSGKFEELGGEGPTGMSVAAYDPASGRAVAAPQAETTWAFSPASGKWEARKTSGAPKSDSIVFDAAAKKFMLDDVAVGVWVLGEGGKRAPARAAELPALVRKEPPQAPVLDEKAKAWQGLFKSLPDDSWLDPGLQHPVMGCMNTAYDPELGMLMLCPSPKGWQVGTPRPEHPEWVMRTFAYDAGTKKWSDLAPAGSEKLPLCSIPGIAYDSRNRAVIFIKNNHGDDKDLNPEVPFGTLFVLDLASNTWKPGKPGAAERLVNGSVAYDPNHNVVICMFGHRGVMRFYRYKGGCPEDSFAPGTSANK